MRIELFTRAGCHLCEDAHQVIEAVLADLRGQASASPHELALVDVSLDPALEARYGNDVPVVLVGGRAAFRHRIGPDELRAALEGR